MRVLYALVCDSAQAREDGRLDVHGVFHQLYAPGFPAQQDRLVLAVALEWEAGEMGAIPFRIDLLDPTGSPTLTISAETEVSAPAEADAPPRTCLVLPLEGVIFPRSGTYEFALHMGELFQPLAPLHLIEHREAF